MDKSKAIKITNIINEISECEDFLKSLDGRSYPDEFEICYRGCVECELEPDILKMIIQHYKNKLEKLNNQLEIM